MPEFEARITGGKAVIIGIVLLIVVIFRLVTLNDSIDDKDLETQLKALLQTEYFPDQVAELSQAAASDNSARMAELTDTITSTSVHIESIEASYPLFEFSSAKDVILKIRFSVKNNTGEFLKGIRYYRFHHSALTGHWDYRHGSNSVSYYMNFM